MKIKSKRTNKKLFITITLVLFLVILAIFYTYQQHHDNQHNQPIAEQHKVTSNSEDNSPVTKNSPDKNNSKAEESNTKNTTTNSDRPDSPIYNNSAKKYNVTISADARDEGKYIALSAIINLSITDGSCQLITTSPNGTIKKHTTKILMAPTTSHCSVVRLNKDSLEKGVWKYQFKYETDELLGESDEHTFEIN